VSVTRSVNTIAVRPSRAHDRPKPTQGSIAPEREGGHVKDLVDTTEMYLRTILELEEEGVPPLRARIAERLHQSGPTVSQTVARMERDGLLRVEGDRHLHLTEEGRAHAISVMRKHRLAELLLVNVIGLPYEDAHEEACRWEHVMSDAVEQRVYDLLNRPTRSPYGNPIPGLAALGDSVPAAEGGEGEPERNLAFPGLSGKVVVRRLCESLQTDYEVLRQLHSAGVDPGATVTIAQERDGVTIDRSGEQIRLPREVASRVFVTAA
jgi:DtxR family transcriptional regulator, Mn-dependent transcriptional regulator